MEQPSSQERKDVQDVVAQELSVVLGSGGDWYVEKLDDGQLSVGDPGEGDQQSNTFEVVVERGYSDEQLDEIVAGRRRSGIPGPAACLPSGYRDVLRVRVEYVRREEF